MTDGSSLEETISLDLSDGQDFCGERRLGRSLGTISSAGENAAPSDSRTPTCTPSANGSRSGRNEAPETLASRLVMTGTALMEGAGAEDPRLETNQNGRSTHGGERPA